MVGVAKNGKFLAKSFSNFLNIKEPGSFPGNEVWVQLAPTKSISLIGT